MSRMRVIGGLGLGALLLAGCEPSRPTGSPIGLTPGTVQYDLRQEQLRSAAGDPARAQQNPTTTGVNVGGIVREGAGAGGTGVAGAPVAVSPGVAGLGREDAAA